LMGGPATTFEQQIHLGDNSHANRLRCQQASLSPLVRTSLQHQTKGSAQTISQHAKHSPRPRDCGAAIIAQRRSDYFMSSPRNRDALCVDFHALQPSNSDDARCHRDWPPAGTSAMAPHRENCPIGTEILLQHDRPPRLMAFAPTARNWFRRAHPNP